MVSMKETITEDDDNFYSRRETILSGPRGPYPHDPKRVISQETCGTDGEFAEEKLPWRVRVGVAGRGA